MGKSKLSNLFKSKASKVAIPDSVKQAPVPRSRDEIMKQYNNACLALGDLTVKARATQQDIDNIFRDIQSLGNELQARQTLEDKQKADEAKAKAVEPVGKDLDKNAPDTTGVDVNV
jgi:hypothetical protein